MPHQAPVGLPLVPALRIVRLDPDLALPAYARQGDAGLDLVARVTVTIDRSGGRAVVPTGVAVAIPPGWAGFVMPRSGLAAEHGITVVNSPGLIDSGYRDEVKVVMLNTDQHDSFGVRRGDRIAQLVLVPVELTDIVVVDDFDDGTAHRGGGFGSTGR